MQTLKFLTNSCSFLIQVFSNFWLPSFCKHLCISFYASECQSNWLDFDNTATKNLWVIVFLMTISLTASEINRIDEFANQALKDWKVPGASVAITQGDKALLVKGYGIRKDGSQEKVNEETIFQLASITKAFTAMALAIEVDNGKITWDEPIVYYLPGFSLMDSYSTAHTNTIDLLAHRTGLPSFAGDLLGKLGYSDKDILSRARFIKPATSFRDKAHYSNMGYFIAGELLGQLTQKNWRDAVQQGIFNPLQMTRSGFEAILDQENVAHPHLLTQNGWKILDWDRTGGFPAAGAIASTASDMAKWMQSLLSGGKGIVKPETIMDMFLSSMASRAEFSEAPPINEFSGFNFGLGWDNYHYNGYLIVEKGGGLDGIRTVTTLIPEKQLGITILCNLNLNFYPEAVRAKFLEEYLGKAGYDLQKEIRNQQSTLDALLAVEEKPKKNLPHRELKLYTGTYSSDLYGDINISIENKTLKASAGPAKYQGTLAAWSNDTFILTWPAVNMGNQKVTFTMGPDGKALSFNTETLGVFQRL